MSIKNNYGLNKLVTLLRVCEDDGAAAAAAEQAAAFQKKIDDAVQAAVSGLKAKNEELLGTVHSLKEKSKAFEGLDPVAMKALKERLDADEDSKLLAEGKKNEVIEKYTQRMRAEHQAQLATYEEKVRAEAQRADTYRGSVLDNQIRAVTSGLHPGAVEDALLHARTIFSLDAKGNAVKLNSDGVPELGKDGSTPYSPSEWMEQQRELKPHWFPTGTSGSGAAGARDGQGQGKTIKRAAYEKLTPHQQATTARSGIQIID